jgi:type III restriction enzyme
MHRPFTARRAPPILIWRHLVSKCVDPATIAVYCDLKHNKEYPLPKEFKLFSGGDKDYETFTAGEYQHVIFNQALQEGWDDPQVAFAYIDKTMGSTTQVEQVIGRVLRQPGAQHYSDQLLNRATFYIRLDNKQQFKPILEEVQKRIGAEPGGVDIRVSAALGGTAKSRQMPKFEMSVPKVYVVSDQAAVEMDAELEHTPDYGAGGANADGAGTREIGTVKVGEDSEVALAETAMPHSSRVTARWIVRREMRTLYPRALHALDDSDHRFDAMLDRTSIAAQQFRDLGRKLVDAFLSGSSLRIEPTDLHKVGPIEAKPGKAKTFKNAIHDAYDLNDFEGKVADAIDGTGLTWCRNPENGGWSIPLLDTGGTYNFYPDFLVWKGKDIFALDPKGGHILASNAYRKVLSVQKGMKGPRVLARLISEGKWSDEVKSLGKHGFTVWSWDMAVGKLQAKHHPTVEKAVRNALVA